VYSEGSKNDGAPGECGAAAIRTFICADANLNIVPGLWRTI